jgi:hypothetical protein
MPECRTGKTACRSVFLQNMGNILLTSCRPLFINLLLAILTPGQSDCLAAGEAKFVSLGSETNYFLSTTKIVGPVIATKSRNGRIDPMVFYFSVYL